MLRNTAVIDWGATNTRIAWNFRSGLDYYKEEIYTLQNYNNQISIICRKLREAEIDKVVLGIASPIDFSSGQLLKPPNMPRYEARRPFTDFSKHNIEVELYNDLELAALGEAVYGAGKQFAVVALVSMATGAGGALVENKIIVRGRYNFEPGHHIIDLNGLKIPGKARGSFESWLSGSSLRYTEHHNPADLPDRLFEERLDRLSQVLVNFTLFWAPEIVILTGPVARRYLPLLPQIRRRVRKNLRTLPMPEIVFGDLGDSAALSGGFSVLKTLG